MPLVDAKCTNCGASLKVDSSKDAAICEYCGSAFIVERAINNYNVTNNISANVVNVYGDSQKDFVIRAGVLEKYNGSSLNVIIPDDVISISEEAFRNLNIESVTIPKSVIEIRGHWGRIYGAFSYCNNLKKIVIPKNVSEIGPYAFYSCKKLEEVVIENDDVVIKTGAFLNCTSLHNVVFSNYQSQSYASQFKNTPYETRKRQEIEQSIKDKRKKENRCQYCGGSFKGFFSKVCSECGKLKDY